MPAARRSANARDILPPDLFARVQEYAAGMTLYVHAEDSGAEQRSARNEAIRQLYAEGVPASDIAEEYGISRRYVFHLCRDIEPQADEGEDE